MPFNLSKKLAKAYRKGESSYNYTQMYGEYRKALGRPGFPVTHHIGKFVLPNGRNSDESAATIQSSQQSVYTREHVIWLCKDAKVEIINLLHDIAYHIEEKLYEFGSPHHEAAKAKIDNRKQFIRTMKSRFNIEEGEIKVHELLQHRKEQSVETGVQDPRDAEQLFIGEPFPKSKD